MNGNGQIINYRTNSAGTWVVLIGIAAKDNRVVGTMQLHSISAGQSQVIEGHAASFHDYAQEKGAVPNTLFMYGWLVGVGWVGGGCLVGWFWVCFVCLWVFFFVLFCFFCFFLVCC